MATGLAAAIQETHPDAVVEKVPGGKGDFVVSVDGRRVWDKRGHHERFPEHHEILEQISADA